MKPAQLAVSIRHRGDPAPRECGFRRVLLGESTHKRQATLKIWILLARVPKSPAIPSGYLLRPQCRPDRPWSVRKSVGLPHLIKRRSLSGGAASPTEVIVTGESSSNYVGQESV